MTENRDRPVPRRDDLKLLLEDLACVGGTLSEIMAAWRRAQPGRPELRPGRLVRLQDDARRLAADLEAAAKESQPSCAAGRLAALTEEAAAVQAVTGGPRLCRSRGPRLVGTPRRRYPARSGPAAGPRAGSGDRLRIGAAGLDALIFRTGPVPASPPPSAALGQAHQQSRMVR